MKKIFAITSSRGDFDLLSDLLSNLKKDKKNKLKIIISGSLTSKKFGNYFNYIKSQKLNINHKILLNLKNDDYCTINKNFAKSIRDFDNMLKKNRPDLVLVLGDRYEVLAIVIATFIQGIKIAHIHGGEETLGAQDNAFRNSISHMSDIHFVSNQQAKIKLNMMGIKKNVYNVGGLGAFNASKIKILKSKKNLSKTINFNFLRKNFLITFHPVTLEKNLGFDSFKNLLKVLKNYKDFGLLFTMSNADNNFNKFNKEIFNFCKSNHNAKIFKQLGKINYFSTISVVDLVIGNSSSGLLEVPSFGTPTINIGSRQEGRIKAKSVIDAVGTVSEIKKAISKGLTREYKVIAKKQINPYYKSNTIKNIISILNRK